MEDKELVGSSRYGKVLIETFTDVGALSKLVSVNGEVTGTTTFYQRTTIIEEPEPEYLPKVNFSNEKIKKPKFRGISKVSPELMSIWRQQYLDRMSLNNGYGVSWEMWCLEQYNIDINK